MLSLHCVAQFVIKDRGSFTESGARPARALGATASVGLALTAAFVFTLKPEPRSTVGVRLKAVADASVCSNTKGCRSRRDSGMLG